MYPLTLRDDRFVDALSQRLALATECCLCLCADTGQLLWINAAMKGWLDEGGEPSQAAVPVMSQLLVRLGAGAEGAWRDFAGLGRRLPLVRCLWPDPDHEGSDSPALLECVSLWLRCDSGTRLLVRLRKLPRDEQTFLQSSSHALLAGMAVDGLPEGSGLMRLDRDGGEAQLAFADRGFSRLLGGGELRTPGLEDWVQAGLSPFDAVLVLAAVATQLPALFVLKIAVEGGGARRWRLGVSPRESGGRAGVSENCALLTVHPKDKVAPPRPARAVDAPPADLPLCLNAAGELLYVDDSWPTLLGSSLDQVLGRALGSLLVPQARQNCEQLLRPVYTGEVGFLCQEMPFVHADQGTRWLELRLWRDLEVPGLLGGSVSDVTERVRERHIRSIQASALEHTVNGVVITDCGQPGQRIAYVNRGFCQLTGYEPAEVIGHNCSFLQGAATDPEAVARLRAAIAAGEPVTEELLNYRRDGTPFWNRIEISPIRDPLSGLVTHFFGLQTDVTLAREARDAALRRAGELERLFRHSPLGIVASDSQGQLLAISPAFGRLVGVELDPLSGASLADLVQAVHALETHEGLPPAWPRPGQTVQWTLTQPTRRVLEVHTPAPTPDSLEQLVYVRDVTAEAELRLMKTQFLATAAHELRAPMGAIRGFSELMLLRDYPRDQQREMLDTVHRQALRMNNLLSDLLDLTKLEAKGEDAFLVAAVRLDEVIDRAVKLVALPGEHREVHRTGLQGAQWVRGNAAKLEQVLINLLSNAIKYSPDGQAVEVSVRQDQARSGWLCLSVVDQGLGLSPEHQAKLFTRFFRAHSHAHIPGTGLGLVIVKELIERMSGQIEVHSVLGQGSTFSVWLQLEGPEVA